MGGLFSVSEAGLKAGRGDERPAAAATSFKLTAGSAVQNNFGLSFTAFGEETMGGDSLETQSDNTLETFWFGPHKIEIYTNPLSSCSGSRIWGSSFVLADIIWCMSNNNSYYFIFFSQKRDRANRTLFADCPKALELGKAKD